MKRLNPFSYPRPIDYKVSPSAFATKSYGAWANKELNDYIRGHPKLPKEEAIELFCMMMDEYCCRARTQESKCMFSIAYDVAMNTLDEVLEEGDRHDGSAV